MQFKITGGPREPIRVSVLNEAPLSKGELNKIKKKKMKNDAIAPEDEPNYVKKVQKEQKEREKKAKALLEQEKEKPKTEEVDKEKPQGSS